MYQSIHYRLAAWFQQLLAQRESLPVRFIEHNGTAEEVPSWVNEVRTALRQSDLDRPFWDEYPLPLLVTATEMGYRYRGTGSSFWPDLEKLLDRPFSNRFARERLSELFEKESRRYGALKPPDTAWAGWFNHIAWPITHALLPLELHSTLAFCLSSLNLPVTSSTDNSEICYTLSNMPLASGSRFQSWLSEEAIVGDVVRGFLGSDTNPTALSPDVLQRLLNDLKSSPGNYQALKEARRLQAIVRRVHTSQGGRSRPQPEPSITVQRQGRWILECVQSNQLRLLAAFPSLPDSERRNIRRQLIAKGYNPSLWNRTRPVGIDSLLAGVRFPVELKGDFPDNEENMLPELENLGLSARAAELLRSLKLPLRLPMVFELSDDGQLGHYVHKGTITSPGEHWALLQTSANVGSAQVLGNVAGLVCIRITDPSNQSEFLRMLGITVTSRTRARLLGDPPLHNHDDSTFLTGDIIALYVQAEQNTSFEIRTNECNGTRRNKICLGAGIWTLQVADSISTAEIDVVSDSDRSHFSISTTSEDIGACFPVELELSGDLTLKSLLSGDLTLEIGTVGRPFEGVALDVRLEWPNGHIGLREFISVLPERLGAAFWKKLLLEEDLYNILAALPPGTGARLIAASPGIGWREWNLSNEPQAVWWEPCPVPDGKEFCIPEAMSDSGPVKVECISALVPWAIPVPKESFDTAPDAMLAIAKVADNTSHAVSSVCLFPRQGRLELGQSIQPPKRLLRQIESTGNHPGFRQLAELYLFWTTATSENWLAEFRRRQAATHLEVLLVSITCGEVWTKAERQSVPFLSSDHWYSLLTYCNSHGMGFDESVHLSNPEMDAFISFAARSMRNEIPDLWSRLERMDIKRPAHGFAEEVSEVLDAVMTTAYQWLSLISEENGDYERAKALRNADPGNTADAWVAALRESKRHTEAWALCDLLVPTEGAEAIRQYRYEDLSLPDLKHLLWEWQKEYRAALQGREWTPDEVAAGLDLWISPSTPVILRTPSLLQRMVADRWTARALRYCALRYKAAEKAPIMTGETVQLEESHHA